MWYIVTERNGGPHGCAYILFNPLLEEVSLKRAPHDGDWFVQDNIFEPARTKTFLNAYFEYEAV